MKHLILFESYENNEKVLKPTIQQIEDYLIDLKDLDYNVYVSHYKVRSTDKYALRISISSKSSKLLPASISDYLLEVDSYLKSSGWVGHNPYDEDNHKVMVNATLNDIKNVYRKEVSEFSDSLSNSKYFSPFHSVSVSYYKLN